VKKQDLAMRLTDILEPSCVRVPLDSTDKQGAIFELIDLLDKAGLISDVETTRDAVWQRESTRTTGIGHGLAIPHGKCGTCKSLIMAVGKPAQPIDFQSIDGRPVDVIMLLVSPIEQTGPHIQALATVSRMMTDTETRAAIHKADSAPALYEIIAAHDEAAAETAPRQ
jgi:mannitol/fructose-specific phosphotransferase system IIA component (Ntr-type)